MGNLLHMWHRDCPPIALLQAAPLASTVVSHLAHELRVPISAIVPLDSQGGKPNLSYVAGRGGTESGARENKLSDTVAGHFYLEIKLHPEGKLEWRWK